MSLLRAAASQRGEVRGLDSGDIPTNGELYPSSTAGHMPAMYSTERAMRHGAVFASINFIADQISTLPIDTYQRDPRDPTAMAEQIPNPPVIAEPAPDIDPISWYRQTLTSWLSQGNLFGLPVAYTDDMRPRLVQIVDPEDMRARRPAGKYGPLTWMLAGKDVPEILHRPAYTLPGQQIGLSPLGLAATIVGLGMSATEFGRRWFLDGAHPSAVFTTDHELSPNQAGKIKRRIMAVLRGHREPLVLGAGLKYEAISVPANESQFLDTIRANVADVARFFGLKATDIGGKSEDSMTYANVEQRSLDRLTYPISPWVVRLEQFMSSLLPPNQFVKFNIDALVRVDLRTRTDVHVKTVQGGLANVDERRALEDLPPLPNGLGQRYLWPPMATTLPATADPAAIAAIVQELVAAAGPDLSNLDPAQIAEILGGM